MRVDPSIASRRTARASPQRDELVCERDFGPGSMVFTRRTAIAAGASTLLLPGACSPFPSPRSFEGILTPQISLDFTKPTGIDPGRAIDWRPGDEVDLSRYYPDQEGMDLLRFARSSDVAYSDIYLDGGLILEMRARSPNQSFGVFYPRPFAPRPSDQLDKVYGVDVRVWFDRFAVRRNWIVPNLALQEFPSFIGSVAAIGTQAKADVGQTSDPDTDKNIGATCVFNYDPGGGVIDGVDPSRERMRLHGPPAQYSNKPHGTFQPYGFSTSDWLHPLRRRWGPWLPMGEQFENTGWPFCLHLSATVSKDSSPATAMLYLDQWRPGAPVSDHCGPGNSKYYTNNLAALSWAGAALVITDATWLPYDLGPALVRITKLELTFDTQPPT
jgi:hypothetical protein